MTFASSQWPCDGCHTWWGGADGKVIIERLCLSLPSVETFNSKVIKVFVPELRSRYVFFMFRDSYVLCIYVMNILCTFPIFMYGYVTFRYLFSFSFLFFQFISLSFYLLFSSYFLFFFLFIVFLYLSIFISPFYLFRLSFLFLPTITFPLSLSLFNIRRLFSFLDAFLPSKNKIKARISHQRLHSVNRPLFSQSITSIKYLLAA